MTQTEALKLALEALDGAETLLSQMGLTHLLVYGNVDKAITAIKEALAQPEQEPTNLERHKRNVQKFLGTQQPKEPEQDEYLSKAYRLANELRCHLAIAPAPQRTWVGLTDKEIAWEFPDGFYGEKITRFARSIEAKLKEKNT